MGRNFSLTHLQLKILYIGGMKSHPSSGPENVEKPQDPEELEEPAKGLLSKPDETPKFLWILRLSGIVLILLSALLLANQHKPAFLRGSQVHIQNGPLGHFLLILGGVCFGIYFIHRLITSFKSR